jgi:CBS domain containing-hemolysin-like protein
LWAGLGILICTCLSALFSGTETALTSLSERSALQMMEAKGRSARLLKAWVDRPNRILSTLLVGNNLVNIAASVLSVDVALWALRGVGASAHLYAEALAVVGTTALLLIFAEVSPKTFARQNAQRLAVPAMWFVRLVEYPLLPAAWAVTKLARLLLRVLGGGASTQDPVVTEEEIEYMIELGAREDVFEEKDRGELLEAALEFGDTLAREVLIPRTAAHALDEQTSVREALDSVISWGHSRVPVYSESIDHVVGVLYAKDLLKAAATRTSPDDSIKKLARAPVYYVPESQKIASTLREMQRRRVHLGVVVDEFGGFAGIITIEDIIEELVGEIRDEYDREEELVRKVDDDTFIASAAVPIRDLEEVLDIEFPEEGDYDTLGGFLVVYTGRVPEVGSLVEWKGLSMEVTAADERHVEQVRITRVPRDAPPETPEVVA